MQPLTRCDPFISVVAGAIGFTLLPGLRLGRTLANLDGRGWRCNRGWWNEDLSASKTAAAMRCYIPSEIFKLPDYAGETGWHSNYLRRLTPPTPGRMVLSDDHPNALRIAPSGQEWSSRFSGFLRWQPDERCYRN